MAKVKYFEALGAGAYVGDYYDDELLQLEEGSTRKSASYYDPELNSHMIFKGRGLGYSGGEISHGTIEQIVFVGDGHVMYKVTGLKENALDLAEFIGTEYCIEEILARALRGKDTMTGSDLGDELLFNNGRDRINGGKGDDILGGGRGVDILTGGKGSDFFHVNIGSDSRDIVTDFHASGGEGV